MVYAWEENFRNPYFFVIFLRSESRAAASLLATAQLNQRRPPSPQPPQLPGQMMSNDRAIRVRTKTIFNACV